MRTHAHRRAAEDIAEDRQVVRREVPGDINVGLQYPEIGADGINIVDTTKRATLDQAAQYLYRCAVHKCMANHEHQLTLVRKCSQLLRMRDTVSKRFLDEHMLASFERRTRQGIVRPNRCS